MITASPIDIQWMSYYRSYYSVYQFLLPAACSKKAMGSSCFCRARMFRVYCNWMKYGSEEHVFVPFRNDNTYMIWTKLISSIPISCNDILISSWEEQKQIAILFSQLFAIPIVVAYHGHTIFMTTLFVRTVELNGQYVSHVLQRKTCLKIPVRRLC